MSVYKFNFYSLVLCLLLVFLFLFREQSALFDTLANYSSLLILIIGLTIIVLSVSKGSYLKLSGSIRSIQKFWTLTVVWMLFIPFVFYDYSLSPSVFYEGMFHDYRHVLFVTLPFFFIADGVNLYYTKIWNYTARFALISGFIAILLVDKSFSSITLRESTFSIPYYLWWVVLAAVSYTYLRDFYSGNGRIGYYLMAIHLVLSFIFLKRAGIVNGLLIIMLSFIFSNRFSRTVVFALVLFSLALIVGMFFNSYLDLLFDRFLETGENLSEWDRNKEIDEFFETVSLSQWTMGYGINNYIRMTYIGIDNKSVNALHIGFYNLFYKGGVLYFLFTCFLGYKILGLFKYIKYNSEVKIGFIMGIVFLIGYSFENSWSYVPLHFFVLLAVYRAIYLKEKLKSERNLVRVD